METRIKNLNKYTKYLLIIPVIIVIGTNRCFALTEVITSITDFIVGAFSKKNVPTSQSKEDEGETKLKVKEKLKNEANINKDINVKKISFTPPFSEYQGYLNKEININFLITDEAGKKYSLNDFKGNVVIVALSTVWCPNCPQVLGVMDILQSKKIKNLKIVALNIGDENIDEVKKHYKDCRINNLDIYQSVAPNMFPNLSSVPTSLIFDKNGKFVCGYVGCVEFLSQEFMDFIKLLLAQ